jgi:hypothetical protein
MPKYTVAVCLVELGEDGQPDKDLWKVRMDRCSQSYSEMDGLANGAVEYIEDASSDFGFALRPGLEPDEDDDWLADDGVYLEAADEFLELHFPDAHDEQDNSGKPGSMYFDGISFVYHPLPAQGEEQPDE